MNDTNARLPSRILPVLLGIILLLAGLAMLAGGIQLIRAGGSFYYAIVGAAFAIDGLLLITARSAALWLYGALLMVSIVWSVYEVRFSWWNLVPRLALWAVIGLILLLPWVRRPLVARGRHAGNGLATPTLIVAVLGAFGLALGSQFMSDPSTIRDALKPITTLRHAASDHSANPAGSIVCLQPCGQQASGADPRATRAPEQPKAVD